MNRLETEMCEMLRKGRETFGWLAVKAEFEAEGTRLDELLRLVEIARRADLQVAVKIGGCEALMDLFQAKQIGADYVVGPMIETAYALTKYAAAVNKAYAEDELNDTDFLWNVETTTGFSNLDQMLDVAAKNKCLAGIVFGRSDYCGSLALHSDDVNSSRVITDIQATATKCKTEKLDLVVGGGVSIDSLDGLREVRSIHLTRFETRKIVMSSSALDILVINDGMLAALQFELKWLTNKRNYYSVIYREDEKRFNTLKSRWGLAD